jgi:hypothetical protein
MDVSPRCPPGRKTCHQETLGYSFSRGGYGGVVWVESKRGGGEWGVKRQREVGKWGGAGGRGEYERLHVGYVWGLGERSEWIVLPTASWGQYTIGFGRGERGAGWETERGEKSRVGIRWTVRRTLPIHVGPEYLPSSLSPSVWIPIQFINAPSQRKPR